MEQEFGPQLKISQELHATKYREEGESFREAMTRVANALKDSEEHFQAFRSILLDMRFLPGGRIQASMGALRTTTPYNCFVSRVIDDSMDGIMDAAKDAAQTMRLGGGIGYDFSTIRPRGDRIVSLGSRASGPVSFMRIFDALCKTIASAGHRRGAQMAVLRVDHPDIQEFIRAKHDQTNLTAFNISVGVTDEFMQAVVNDDTFTLKWNGTAYKEINARSLWDEIMRSTWDWGEPGVVFLDTINKENNLWYYETITTTNPCGEQPLPPYGACLLGSFNLTRYVVSKDNERSFDWKTFNQDIPPVVRAMDNVIDRAVYPLKEQAREARNKRRIGIGITGFANASEALGFEYGSPESIGFLDKILETLTVEAYVSSIGLAIEKGPFPGIVKEHYINSPFIQRLPQEVISEIAQHGIRNSHLISIAPTGTISLSADNVSSGIEPVFSHNYERLIQEWEGPRIEKVEDYGVRYFGVRGRTTEECTVQQHIEVLLTAQKWVDSAVSKTCNVSGEIAWDDFKDLYFQAWEGGAKGCTTFRTDGKRDGILVEAKEKRREDDDPVCSIDPITGVNSCDG